MPVTNRISCLGSGIPINLCPSTSAKTTSHGWVGHSIQRQKHYNLLNLQVVFQPSFVFINMSQIDMSLFKHITLQGTNISPQKWHFEDDFPFPKVGYVNSLECNQNYSQLPDVSRHSSSKTSLNWISATSNNTNSF